jgi:hypothetical protein
MTQVEPHLLQHLGFCLGRLANAAGGARDQDWKLELLFVVRLSSATMTGCGLLLWARRSGIVGWVVSGLPWEVGAAGCFATMCLAMMTHGSVYFVASRGCWVG